MKLLNFENWVNGEVSKSAKIWLSKSINYVKNYPNLSIFFFSLKNINSGAHFLLLTFFDITSIFKQLYVLSKMRPNFWHLNFLWAKIFLILYHPLENSTSRIAITKNKLRIVFDFFSSILRSTHKSKIIIIQSNNFLSSTAQHFDKI